MPSGRVGFTLLAGRVKETTQVVSVGKTTWSFPDPHCARDGRVELGPGSAIGLQLGHCRQEIVGVLANKC